MEQWEVARCGGTCVVTNRELAEGEDYYAVLFEEGESFRREDYSLDAWQGPPAGAFCFFKTRVPLREKKKRLLVDNDVIVNFFTRLADETAELRLHFRFVLALILMRKRLLKYQETEQENGREFWTMRLVRDKEAPAHRVLNPRLNDAQIENVSRELSAILHGDMGAFDDLPECDDPPGAEADDDASLDADNHAEETRIDAAE